MVAHCIAALPRSLRTRGRRWRCATRHAGASPLAERSAGPWQRLSAPAFGRKQQSHRMALLAELFGQSDDDALRATQEAEPVDVLVLRDLADEFGTVGAQAGND